MPSNSLIRWRGERAQAMNEIEHAHLRVGGSARGRRYATQQINHAYATLLSSQFQGYCRDLHSECVEHIVGIVPTPLQGLLRAEFIWNRSLDKGNPHPGAIGSDFNRLGVDFWTAVYSLQSRNDARREKLDELIEWRNAIAHQDFSKVGPPTLQLGSVRRWRRAVSVLAENFDQVMYNYLSGLLPAAPW
jgi:hypothetical protein